MQKFQKLFAQYRSNLCQPTILLDGNFPQLSLSKQSNRKFLQIYPKPTDRKKVFAYYSDLAGLQETFQGESPCDVAFNLLGHSSKTSRVSLHLLLRFLIKVTLA